VLGIIAIDKAGLMKRKLVVRREVFSNLAHQRVMIQMHGEEQRHLRRNERLKQCLERAPGVTPVRP